MTISDLSHDQQVALVALVRALVMSDGMVIAPELKGISELAGTLGDEAYRALFDEADRRVTDLETLKQCLASIEDAEARALIFGTAWEEAVADPDVNHTESELLGWLAGTWSIQPV